MTRISFSDMTASRTAERRMREWALDLEVQQRKDQQVSTDELKQRIHPCITISRETGAGGGTVARLLGERLKLDVLHREILDDMAQRFNLPRAMLEHVDETTSNWFLEVFGKWIDRRVVTQSEYIVHLGRLLLMAAQHASTVVVGRGAQFLLPSDKCLKVYLVAPMDVRVETIRRIRGVSASDAKQHIRETDQGRQDFISKYFNRQIGDPHLYDLVINRANLDPDAVADVISDLWFKHFAQQDDS